MTPRAAANKRSTHGHSKPNPKKPSGHTTGVRQGGRE
jgi:hypothetical protein